MELFVVYLLLSLVVGGAASQRGQSGIVWMFLAIVITPLFALILLVIVPNKAEENRRQAALEASNRIQRRQLAVLASIAARPSSPEPAAANPTRRADPLATIASLAEARDRGLITADEFEAKKSELLDRL